MESNNSPIKEKLSKEVETIIGSRLKERRTKLGLKLSDVARRLGITFQQVYKYEKGADRIPASRLFKLCKVLSVPYGFFDPDIEKDNPHQREIKLLVTCANLDGKQFIIKFLDHEGAISDIKVMEEKEDL